MGSRTNQGTHDDTQHQRFAQHAELLFQTLSINVELREAGDAVEQPVDSDGKRRKTLTERLRNADTVHILIVALEAVCRQVCHHQRHNIAADGSEIAPQQRLIHHEVGYSTDKGEVPIVPQVNVHRTCTLGNKQQEVDAQADGNNQCANGCIIGHSGGGRPSHVEHSQIQIENLGDCIKGCVEVGSQQSRDDAQAHKTDTNIQAALERLAELHAYAQADNRKKDWHHHRCP